MAELKQIEKETLVRLLAQFQRPAEIAIYMAEEFGLTVSIQQIVKYDPTRPGFDAGEIWRPIFAAAREQYLKDVSAVPLSNQAYRLWLLQRGVDEAQKARNWRLVAHLAEQAAKEVGRSLTNSSEVNLSEGRHARDMSPEERRAKLALIISLVLEKSRREQEADRTTQH